MDKAQKPKFNLYEIEENYEHDLYESVLVEFNDIRGIEVEVYILKDTDKYDPIYGERAIESYEVENMRRTKVSYQPQDETSIVQSFGITSDETVHFMYIPSYTWSRDISPTVAPKVGDVIRTVWNQRNYIISWIDYENNVFNLKKFTYDFICKPFKFGEQSDSATEILLTGESTSKTTTISEFVSAWGDNEEIEDESNDITTYSDVDTSIYGY